MQINISEIFTYYKYVNLFIAMKDAIIAENNAKEALLTIKETINE